MRPDHIELARKAGFHIRDSMANIQDGVDWSCGSHGYDQRLGDLIELVKQSEREALLQICEQFIESDSVVAVAERIYSAVKARD